MRLRTRSWFLLSLLLFGGAALFWWLGNRRDTQQNRPVTTNSAAARPFNLRVTNYLAATNPDLKSLFAVVATNPPNAVNTNRLAYRLSNTKQPFKELVRNERAVLLR